MSILSCLSCVHLPMLIVSDPASEGVHSLARFSPIAVVVDDGVPYSPGIKKILLQKSGILPGLFQDRLFPMKLLLMSMVYRLTLASTRYGLKSLELCQNGSGIEPVPWNSRVSTNDVVKERWCPAPLLILLSLSVLHDRLSHKHVDATLLSSRCTEKFGKCRRQLKQQQRCLFSVRRLVADERKQRC
jgi:hypothetical protein